MFFVLFALTTDVCCFLFIPVHWLFFAASTYVWVQYVWHTDRGICLPTVSLWLLFVYVEASVRLKELKSPSPSQHFDLCRPFAAHCIGYPVVSLGFGFKSYISYRMRLRKQREVAKANEFFMELMQQALPKECLQIPSQQAVPGLPVEHHIANTSNSSSVQNAVLLNANGRPLGVAVAVMTQVQPSPGQPSHHSSPSHAAVQNGVPLCRNSVSTTTAPAVPVSNGSVDRTPVSSCSLKLAAENQVVKCNSEYDAKKTVTEKQELHFEKEYMEQQIISPKKVCNVNDFDEEADFESVSHKNSFKNSISASLSNGTASSPAANSLSASSPASKWTPANQSNVILNSSSSTASGGNKKRSDKNLGIANNLKENMSPGSSGSSSRDDSLHQRLESDVKRLKADLQSSRQTEQELRAQINALLNKRAEEERLRCEIQHLQHENDSLQNKLQNLQIARQQDKQSLTQLEKRVQEEKKLKAGLENQLKQEQEKKKQIEAKDQTVKSGGTSAAGRQQQVGGECVSESCRMKKRELENDLKMMKRELKLKEERLQQAEQSLRQYKDSHGDTEVLMSALAAMQDKNAHLEHSLSAETRLKLDLFSALGDTKRQLEISQALMAKKEKETEELKSKVAEVMACMPNAYSLDPNNSLVSSILFNSKFLSLDSSGVGTSSRSEVSSDL